MPHAPFPPSSAKRWLNCPGSFALGLQRAGSPDSEYSIEGTRLHSVASAYLTQTKPRAPVMPAEDYVAIKIYLNYAAECIERADAFAIEETIHRSLLLYGTPDLMAFYKKQSMLEVVDLKTGAGIMVDPVENDQALCYAWMAVMKLIRQGTKLPRHIRLTIVQPPDEASPVKSWDTTLEHVLAWGAAAEAKIAEALAGGAPVRAGEWCRFCAAKPYCPVLRGEVVEALGNAPAFNVMSPAVMAQWLDRTDRLEAWINGFREAAHEFASWSLGAHQPGIPGWGLKPKRATRQWADEEVVLEIARRRKIKIFQDKMLSPAMAEKAHPNLPEELRDQIVAVSSGVNLVRLKPGEAGPLEVKKPDDEASLMQKQRANIALMKHRR